MTTADHDDPPFPDLTQATRDAAAQLDAEIAATRPIPDFSAMLAALRRLTDLRPRGRRRTPAHLPRRTYHTRARAHRLRARVW
jgi:hypothetical protein